MKSCWNQIIGSIPRQVIACIKVSESIERAIVMLQDSRFLLVKENNEIVGVCSETDIINRFVGGKIAKEDSVTCIMSRGDIALVSVNTTIGDSVACLKEKGSHYLIVEQDGKHLGLVSTKEILNFFAEYYPEDILNIPPDASIISKEAAGA